jgi:hypothetical protein
MLLWVILNGRKWIFGRERPSSRILGGERTKTHEFLGNLLIININLYFDTSFYQRLPL